ncbi:MAG TPA: RNA polymerase sigma factor [Rugosimonospora sp.]|jgi:RNA polymerase sigma-70 factor (ECF subfamily)
MSDIGGTDADPPASEPTDAQVLAGRPDEFGVVFDRYSRVLYGYCARRVGPDLAEDVVAETLLTAFEQRHRFDQTAQTARPWLFGIATNLLRNHRRAEVRGWRALARTGADPLDGVRRVTDGIADRVDQRVDAAQAVQAIAGALAAMPRGHRDVLLMYAWSGLDYAELAAALGLPIGTVRSRLHRARARLRQALPPHSTV